MTTTVFASGLFGVTAVHVQSMHSMYCMIALSKSNWLHQGCCLKSRSHKLGKPNLSMATQWIFKVSKKAGNRDGVVGNTG